MNQERSGPEEKFLRVFFTALNESGVLYAVLRNYRTLPFSANGSDLDILITTTDAVRARTILFESIASSNGVAIGIAESIGFFKVHAFGKIIGSNETWWGLCIDINNGLNFRGLPLLIDDGGWPIQKYHDIRVLADDFAGVLGVLKELLNNEKFPVRYAAAAQRMAMRDRVKMAQMLAPMGTSALSRFHSILLNSSKLSKESIGKECKALCHDFFKYSFKRYRLRLVWLLTMHNWKKVYRYLRPSGVVLAVLGVDGAGKSTIINSILPILNAATHNNVVVRHLRPSLLPPLAHLKGKNKTKASNSSVLEPHSSRPSGKLLSLFRLAYLTLDYILGYWLWTRPKIAKQPTIVIFDRYAYDMKLDPRRFRIGLSGCVAGWFAGLAPKPDLIFCLYANPEVVAARKCELSVEETIRQVDALREFARHEQRAVLISTDTDINETRDQVLQTLYNFFERRVKVSL